MPARTNLQCDTEMAKRIMALEDHLRSSPNAKFTLPMGSDQKLLLACAAVQAAETERLRLEIQNSRRRIIYAFKGRVQG